MRAPSWLEALATACAMAAFAPAAAAEIDAVAGAARLSFGSAGPLLTRSIDVALDGPSVAVDWRSAQCAAPALAVARDTSTTCAEGPRATGEAHQLSATLKLPQWRPDAPTVDLALRSWRERIADDVVRAATGSSAEAELTQVLGPYEIVAGLAQSLSGMNGARWRSGWAGASVRFGPRARVRLMVESARETASGARDRRYSVQIARLASAGVRISASLARAPDDPARAWQAALGIEVAF